MAGKRPCGLPCGARRERTRRTAVRSLPAAASSASCVSSQSRWLRFSTTGLCSPEGYYTCIPAFFHTLLALRQSGRPFSIVLRTFGTDLPRVQAAINAFAEGKHPLHPGASDHTHDGWTFAHLP